MTALFFAQGTSHARRNCRAMSVPPHAIVVSVEIKPETTKEFREAIEIGTYAEPRIQLHLPSFLCPFHLHIYKLKNARRDLQKGRGVTAFNTILQFSKLSPNKTSGCLSQAMKIDAEGSRTEPACHRFDVLQDKSNPNKYLFYEVQGGE